MILNAYAVLSAFLALLRLLFGLLVVGLGIKTWLMGRKPMAPEGHKALEDRGSLLFLMAFLLLGLNLVSWPLLYLLLQSYVPQWPGVMCIYGVTRIGSGSLGASRFLPDLLKTLQVTKPLLVFAGGAWFVLYLLNRRTATAPLHSRIFLGLIFMGFLATVDAATEGTYLVIPKKEEFLSAGCCTEIFDTEGRSSRFLPQALLPEDARPVLYGAYYGINGALILALFLGARSLQTGKQTILLSVLLLMAILAVPISAVFLIEIASPALLHRPDHHCPYDLVSEAPESILAVALFLWGTFCTGWAGVAAWFGACEETQSFFPDMVRRVMMVGFWSYLASLVMMSVELALA
jgi:hypothetical protein